MKVDTNQRTMIRFNKGKYKTWEKQWYELRYFDLIHMWYDFRNHESNQTTWPTRTNDRKNDWYNSKYYESNQRLGKRFLPLKNEDFHT